MSGDTGDTGGNGGNGMRRLVWLSVACWLIWLGPWIALIVVEIMRRSHRLALSPRVGTGARGLSVDLKGPR